MRVFRTKIKQRISANNLEARLKGVERIAAERAPADPTKQPPTPRTLRRPERYSQVQLNWIFIFVKIKKRSPESEQLNPHTKGKDIFFEVILKPGLKNGLEAQSYEPRFGTHFKIDP